MSEFDLLRFERWMMSVISHPDGVDAGVERARAEWDVHPERLQELVIPSRARTAQQRLGVYANMYFWRLVDVLREEHPALEHALGGVFYDTMVAYLVANPSRNYRLAPLGDRLPTWLQEHAPVAEDVPHADFLADLAALERAAEHVFDARESPLVTPEQLGAIAPDAWPDVRIGLVSALRLVPARYPVNAFFQAVIDGDSPHSPEPESSWTVVWRHDLTVWRHALSYAQYVVLEEFGSGATLGEALEAALERSGLEPDDLMGSVGAWFQTWTSDGLFSTLSTD